MFDVADTFLVLSGLGQARTWRFLGKLRELASFSVENEDLFALEAIKKSVFRPSEPLSAKVKLYVSSHCVRTGSSDRRHSFDFRRLFAPACPGTFHATSTRRIASIVREGWCHAV